MFANIIRFAFTIVVFIILSGCTSQLKLGEDAYNQGKYDVAAHYWNPIAKNGNPYAQFYVGLLWEGGLGSTQTNINEAAKWYLLSAQQGYVPAMVHLAIIQKSQGYEDASLSWFTLAARWGNMDAIDNLDAWGKTIPPPDLLHQKISQDNIAHQQMIKSLSNSAYSLGCAAGGGCSQSSVSSFNDTDPVNPSKSYNSPASTSESQYDDCSSDLNCGFGFECVKKPLASSGICMKSVDELGMQQHNTPENSIGPNVSKHCQFKTDCPIGFECDNEFKTCVQR